MRPATQTVMDIGELNLRGNIIPHIWYKRLVKEVKLGRNKETFERPYLEAIIILSDVIYWYRPVTIRDEGTGQIIEVNRKFKSDKLQRSYQQLADQFGFGKDQAKAACKWLEDKGLITMEFRNINAAGIPISNVLFIEPVTENVKRLCELNPTVPYAFTKAHPPIEESTPPDSPKDTYTQIPSDNSQREEESFPQNSNFPPREEPPAQESILTETDPLLMAAKVQERTGGKRSMTIPAAAGGADPYLDGPLSAACTIFRILPGALGEKEASMWAGKLQLITEGVKDGTPELFVQACRMWKDHGPSWKGRDCAPYSGPYSKAFGEDVQLLMRQIASGTITTQRKGLVHND